MSARLRLVALAGAVALLHAVGWRLYFWYSRHTPALAGLGTLAYTSGWATQVRDARRRLSTALESIHELAAGGTAVGTELNAPEDFGEEIAAKLAELTGLPLVTAPKARHRSHLLQVDGCDSEEASPVTRRP